jgi:hypothetical protein
MEKRDKALKDSDGRNSSQKDEVTKSDDLVLNFGGSGFLRTDRVRLLFEI